MTNRQKAFLSCTAHTLARLEAAGLLQLGDGCQLSPHARLIPTDCCGASRPIHIADGCVVAAGAVLRGGAALEAGAVVEEQVIVGRPERGYAVGSIYPGAGDRTRIGAGVVLRAGAIVYAGVQIGPATTSATTRCCEAMSASAPTASSAICWWSSVLPRSATGCAARRCRI